jgi:hypothetical protein
MANDPRYRSSRPDRLSQDRPSGDPLSELARLIGQDDAVAATARNGASRRHRDSADREEVSPAPPRRGGPSPEELHEDSRAGPDRHGRYDDSDARQAAYLAEPPAAGLQEGHGYDPRTGNGAGYHGYEEEPGFRRGNETDDHVQYGEGEAEAYDAPAYDDRYDEDPEAAGYDNGPYYGQDGRMPDDLYEAPPPRRRSRLFPIAVVLGVAVVGTAAAYAYRTFTNSGSDTPPVIKASTEPTKQMATGSDQPGKQIYDRLDRGQGQNEQVVSREEEPVNVQGRPTSGDSLTTAGTAAIGTLGGLPSGGPVASPPMLSGGTPTTDGEPRRVRTIPIRPDQGGGAAAPETNTATPPPPEMPAAAAPTPAAPMPAAQAPAAPAPTASRGRGARAPKPPPTTVAATEPPAQAEDSEPPAAHAPSATTPAAASGQPHRGAAVSNAADGAGHYVVQVSSQRSEADAQASYKALQQKYASLLGGHDPIIRRADLGEKGTFYRAQVGPFATMDEATQLCNSLKSAGGQCIIQRN